MSIIIDKEFESLIPPLSPEEYAQLEENCVREGIRDPLVVWDSDDGEILVDGHNRMKISAEHGGIPFQIVRMHFDGRDSVKEWIVKNQFGRRNIPIYMRAWLALKLKPIIAEKAEKNLHQGNKPLQKSVNPVNAQKELATIAGVSHDTIHKVEAVENSGNEEIKAAARSGDISVNKAYQQIQAEKKRLEEENAELKKIVVELKDREPEIREVQVEVVPADYKAAKQKARAYDADLRTANNKIIEANRAKREAEEKIQELEDKIAEISTETPQGEYFKNLEAWAVSFNTHCDQFIRWVGGYVWLTNNADKLDDAQLAGLVGSVQMVYEWAGTLLTNIQERTRGKYEHRDNETDQHYLIGADD